MRALRIGNRSVQMLLAVTAGLLIWQGISLLTGWEMYM